MRTQEEISDAVYLGAKLLDKKEPGWVNKFVKAGLENGFDMSDGSACILGNVFGTMAAKETLKYERLVEKIESSPDFDYDAAEYPEKPGDDGYLYGRQKLGIDAKATAYGFNATADLDYPGKSNPEWQLLAEAWQLEVLVRLAKKRTMWGKVKAVFAMKAA